MNINTCCVCEKRMRDTYSLKIVKESKPFYTCSYNCNQNVCRIVGEDYWDYVKNKSDFIKPVVDKPKMNYEEFTFTEHETDIILDPERYESQYEIYLENKRIDEILDDYSDKSSNYSEEDDY